VSTPGAERTRQWRLRRAGFLPPADPLPTCAADGCTRGVRHHLVGAHDGLCSRCWTARTEAGRADRRRRVQRSRAERRRRVQEACADRRRRRQQREAGSTGSERALSAAAPPLSPETVAAQGICPCSTSAQSICDGV
jgi:hypothetical protein